MLGLTFKPETDDMRESVSLYVIPKLLASGAKIKAYDPKGMKEAKHYLKGDIAWCDDADTAMKEADILVILTEWNEFRSLDLKKVKSLMRGSLVVDLRNIYKRQDMRAHGFHYVSVGRQETKPNEPWIADLNIESEFS